MGFLKLVSNGSEATKASALGVHHIYSCPKSMTPLYELPQQMLDNTREEKPPSIQCLDVSNGTENLEGQREGEREKSGGVSSPEPGGSELACCVPVDTT